MTDNSLKQYKNLVNGASKLSELDVQKKMTRNMILGYLYKEDSPDSENPRLYYSYGNMRFIVRGERVIWVGNNYKAHKEWKKDKIKKNKLDRVLRIEGC